MIERTAVVSRPQAVAVAVLTSVILALGLLGIATTVAQAGSYGYDRDAPGGVSLSMIPVTFDGPSCVWVPATLIERALHGALPRFGVAAKAADEVVLSQVAKRRLAKELGGVPRSATPVAQATGSVS